MGTSGLPDIYIQSPRAAGTRHEGVSGESLVHITYYSVKLLSAHGYMVIKCTLLAKIMFDTCC